MENESQSIEQIALDNCDREPVHIPGRIQSFGAMVACDLRTLDIVGISRNFQDIVPATIKAELGRNLGDLFEERDLIHSIRGALSLPTVATQRVRIGMHKLGQFDYDIAVSTSEDHALVEFERVPAKSRNADAPVAIVRSMIQSLDTGGGAVEMMDSAVKSLRRLTGFDRVMAYHFLDDGVGEVVAEAKSPGVDPWLGLRYPASDIPNVVRKLMVRCPYRIISDVEDPNSELVVADGAGPIDLSTAHLRGVSPIHVEYLKNMEVRSSMNTSIIVRGDLWGLFAFHHCHPIVLPPELRSIVELFGHVISLQLQQRLEQAVLDKRKRAESIFRSLGKSTGSGVTEVFLANAHNFPTVLDCEGAALVIGDEVTTWGRCPDAELILQLKGGCDGRVHTVTSMSDLSGVGDSNGICGAAIVEMGQAAKAWLLFFRPEVVERVRWAGPGEKKIVYGPNGPRLHPRASFEEYVESVRGRSTAWTQPDVEAAIEIAGLLRDQAFSSIDESRKEWNRQRDHKDLLIAELNHRVKNILALVKSIARQTQDSAQSLNQYTEAFEQRINALSTAHDLIGGSGLRWAEIRELLETELRAFINSSKVVSLSGPPLTVSAAVAPLLALVFHELVSNSVKYGALSANGESLSVSWKEDAGGLEILWNERVKVPLKQPERRGFGLTLIERSVPHECKGTCDMTFKPEGLEVRFWLPDRAMGESAIARDATAGTVTDKVTGNGTNKVSKLASSTHQQTSANTERQQSSHTSVNIVVVEDKSILALEMESLLTSNGYPGVQIFNDADSCQAAVLDNRSISPELAILDINLGSTTSYDLAEKLKAQGVQIIFVSGHQEPRNMPESLSSAPRLKKPLDTAGLDAITFPTRNQEAVITVLIMEDQTELASYWREALESAGYVVVHAVDYAEAVSLLEIS